MPTLVVGCAQNGDQKMPKLQEPPPLSEAQLEIMNIVWEQPACTVTDVWQGLNLHRKVARNTVLTLMTRLADKGWVTQTKCGRGFTYSATREKDRAQCNMAQRLVNAAFGGSLNGLVMALIDDGQLPASELDAIRETIERAKSETAK